MRPTRATAIRSRGPDRTNLVNHLTYLTDPSTGQPDNIWSTFTETDHVAITDTGTGETFSGELTFWGNFNLNEKNTNSSFTGNGQLHGNQGGIIGYHEVSHFATNALGQVTVSFDNPTFTW
jgi:hypothetical protein